MFNKPAITQVDIHEIIAKRWSSRAFDPTKPVTHEQLLALMEAARWAPSCHGDQPWRYLICDKSTDLTAWEKMFNCIKPLNQVWAKNVPVLILSGALNHFTYNDELNRWAQYDAGAASQNISLQAVSLGLATCQMGGFEPEKVREAFHIPNDITCIALIAVGHRTTYDTLPERYHERELEERKRSPLGENFFEGEWGKPFTSIV